jgi:hypothetical protein
VNYGNSRVCRFKARLDAWWKLPHDPDAPQGHGHGRWRLTQGVAPPPAGVQVFDGFDAFERALLALAA